MKVKWCAWHVGTQMTTLRKKDETFAEWKGNWRSEERESGRRGLVGTSFQEAEAGLDGHVTSQPPTGETSPPREPRGACRFPAFCRHWKQKPAEMLTALLFFLYLDPGARKLHLNRD